MQALQYTRSLEKIVKEMKVQELTAFLAPAFSGPGNAPLAKEQFSALLFSSRAGFERLNAEPLTAKVLTSLHVAEIYEPARLGHLIWAVANAQNAGALRTNPEFVQFHALVQSLGNLQQSCSALLEKEKLEPAKDPADVLELRLIDYDGVGIDAHRLQWFVLLLRQLHTNFARIFNVQDDQLTFIYFDSGSDLVVALQCAKVILDAIKNLFGEWWDNVRFREFDTFEKKMAAVSQGLSVATAVQEAIAKHVLDQETGDILKVRVIKEVDKLIGLGASLPADQIEVDQRRLLLDKRDLKLLGPGVPPEDV